MLSGGNREKHFRKLHDVAKLWGSVCGAAFWSAATVVMLGIGCYFCRRLVRGFAGRRKRTGACVESSYILLFRPKDLTRTCSFLQASGIGHGSFRLDKLPELDM